MGFALFFPPAKKLGMLDLGAQIARCAYVSEENGLYGGRQFLGYFSFHLNNKVFEQYLNTTTRPRFFRIAFHI